MSKHFQWYPGTDDVIVPWNAQYAFPSQANKAVKMTPRIPPKNGGSFTPGQVIRVEFPAQGYVNPMNTTLEFDVTLSSWSTVGYSLVRFQNNIQSIFNRVRLLYGATPLEDIINYNVIVRCLTEWTCTGQNGLMDQSTICDGIGGCMTTMFPAAAPATFGYTNVRQAFIQGVDTTTTSTAGGACGFGSVPNEQSVAAAPPRTATYDQAYLSARKPQSTRRYQIGFGLGLFTQDKLIPTKFMASQLAIEMTLESAEACIFSLNPESGGGSGSTPTYTLSNINLIPEILEFDASYDAMFLRGLREGGVPIQFSSWHTFIFNAGNTSNVNAMVQERSRSVKALFAVQRRQPVSIATDTHATFFSSGGTMQNYQFRIGGRYFPAAPVQLSTEVGSSFSNGGAEAFIELQKALNIMGDYRLSTGVTANRWAVIPAATAVGVPGSTTVLSELDYQSFITYFDKLGRPVYHFPAELDATGSALSGNVGSACYASAISLETSNGLEISGLNAEEQSDISFLANWSGAQASGFVLEVYAYYDAMIILRENNVRFLLTLGCRTNSIMYACNKNG